MKRPRPLLTIALLATVAISLAAALGGGGTEVVQPVARATAAVPATPIRTSRLEVSPAVADISLRLAQRPEARREPRDLFAAYNWLPPPPPPPPPAPPAPPPPPVAPPLPVVFGGMFEIDGAPIFLLIEGEHTYRVPIGGQVGEFRLDSATDRSLVFVHIPTGLTQTLAIGGAPLALVH